MSRDDGILIISPESWDQHFVSKHHYAMTLARRGARVLFVNPPDNALEDMVLREEGDCPGLTVVDGPPVARGLRFYPSALRQRLERRWLERLERIAGHRVGTVWLFENSRFFDMGFAGRRLKIYHQVDLNQAFNPENAARTADICFCTTDFIRDRLEPHGRAVHKIHHGLAEVMTPGVLAETQSQRFDGVEVNAVYVGNLEMTYLDVELLAETVRRHATVRFHFVGRAGDGCDLKRALEGQPNVVWWGRVEHQLLPEILSRADLLLVCYRAEEFREQLASPHKFMEYLASGKTIVSTYTDEYKDKRHLLAMTERNEEYLDLFASVLGDLEAWNHPRRQAERREFARQHSYDRQLELCEKHLSERGLSLGLEPLANSLDSGQFSGREAGRNVADDKQRTG